MLLSPRSRRATRTIVQQLREDPERQWSSNELAELVGLPVNFVVVTIISELIHKRIVIEGDRLMYKINPAFKEK